MRTLICLPLAFGAILLYSIAGFSKDVNVDQRDNDKIVSCKVGDTVCVYWYRGAIVKQNDNASLAPASPWVSRGCYKFDVKKAGNVDLEMQRCFVTHCKHLMVHVQASESKK